MSDTKEYIVTRGGREVLRGDDTEILNAARQGRLLSNDLVYDSSTSQWSFARSLGILRGFPLRNRPAISNDANTDTSVIETGRRLFSQRRRFQRALRGFGVVVALAIFTGVLFLIPEVQRTGTKKDDLKNVLELDDRAMKIEGSGQGFSDSANKRKGSSNMDSKAVTVDGEHSADLETDNEGRKAGLLLTPEERAELAKVVQPGSGDGKSSAGQSVGEIDGMNEPEKSPSIDAPELTEPLSELNEQADQPLVLIRPKLEKLKRELSSLVDASSQQAEGQTRREDLIGKAAGDISRLESQIEQSTAPDSSKKELTRMVDSIRKNLRTGCGRLQRAEHCRLRVEHPDWTPATLSAVIRKDVILGMSAEQVTSSIGKPLERREIADQTVWCYDEKCKRRVEFTNERVMAYRAAVLKSDSSIETAPQPSSKD